MKSYVLTERAPPPPPQRDYNNCRINGLIEEKIAQKKRENFKINIKILNLDASATEERSLSCLEIYILTRHPARVAELASVSLYLCADSI